MENTSGPEVESKDVSNAVSNVSDEKDADTSVGDTKSGDTKSGQDVTEQSGTEKDASKSGKDVDEHADAGAEGTSGGKNGEVVKEPQVETLTAEENGGDGVEENKDDETIDVSNEPPLENDARNKMFEEGLKHDKDGQKLEALKCYLKCLVGLKENTNFALLPQCLRNIGDIYYSRDEYAKAISFIQAEKLYYESVLIDDTELQKHIDEVTAEGAAASEEDTNVEALRATEYEQLSRLCMDEKQPQLALEYAGKCTKLRQKVFGDGHPIVKQTLDYFATVYAEVGKVQYTESMSKYDTAGEPDITGNNSLTDPNMSTGEPTSILRRRKNTEGSEREKRVRFDESQVPSDGSMDREEKIARAVLLVLFCLLLVVLVILGVYIFCNLQPSDTCRNIRRVLNDSTMHLKYLYYQLWSKEGSKYT